MKKLTLTVGFQERCNPLESELSGPNTCPACGRHTRKVRAGVCVACADKFSKRHLNGKEFKPPTATEDPPAIRHFDDPDAAGYVAPGEAVTTCGFDYPHDSVEVAAGEDIHELAEGLRAILSWLWSDGYNSHRPRAALIKLTAMSATLNPELFDNKTFEQIGKLLKTKKQNLSNAAVEFEERFGIQFRRGRTAAARKRMRDAMIASHAKRHLEQRP